jgi:hypothetical protein
MMGFNLIVKITVLDYTEILGPNKKSGPSVTPGSHLFEFNSKDCASQECDGSSRVISNAFEYRF